MRGGAPRFPHGSWARRDCAKLTRRARRLRAGATRNLVAPGRGAAWLARRSGGPKAASSNLAVPTSVISQRGRPGRAARGLAPGFSGDLLGGTLAGGRRRGWGLPAGLLFEGDCE